MESKPHCIIVMGMAGSGKTMFVRYLISCLKMQNKQVYSVNLDPAIRKLLFAANLDICDTINYKKLMQDCFKLVLDEISWSHWFTQRKRGTWLYSLRHSRPNRNIFLVSLRYNHNRFSGLWVPDKHSLRGRFDPSSPSKLLHVQHAIRYKSILQKPSSNNPSIQQNRFTTSREYNELDGWFRRIHG